MSNTDQHNQNKEKHLHQRGERELAGLDVHHRNADGGLQHQSAVHKLQQGDALADKQGQGGQVDQKKRNEDEMKQQQNRKV